MQKSPYLSFAILPYLSNSSHIGKSGVTKFDASPTEAGKKDKYSVLKQAVPATHGLLEVNIDLIVMPEFSNSGR
jgi:hypothetical protein